ncbi:Uncharacterised protein [Fusobacterium necrophorum subsp. necrophorum]|nr:Uncharacterised protein [Fusobacterium necrophorum subsp. necrophorum]
MLDRFLSGSSYVFAITIVPSIAYFHGGGIDGIQLAMKARDISLTIFQERNILIFLLYYPVWHGPWIFWATTYSGSIYEH